MEQNFEDQRFSADLGGGRRIDFEMPADSTAWLAVGRGIHLTDVWLKDVGDSADLRVRIKRRGTTVEVSIDRGEQSVDWWPPEAAPRLQVTLDPSRGTASVSAVIGTAGDSPTN